MKKTVKSRVHLNEAALATGATITSKNGTKFNSSAKKSKVIKKPSVKKKIVKPDQSTLIAEAVDKNTSELRYVIEELRQQISQIKLESPGPVLAWDFDFIRNPDGSIKTLKARVPDLNIITH